MDDFFRKLKSATPFVAIPEELHGLKDVADFSESIEREFSSAFWNTPRRDSMTDAQYIGMAISILKKRMGKKGVLKALEIIKMIEMNNNA